MHVPRTSPLVLLYKTVLPLLRGGILFWLVFGKGRLDPDNTTFLLDYVPVPLRIRDWGWYATLPFIRALHDGLLWVFGYVRGSKVYLGGIVIGTLILGYQRSQWVIRQWYHKASSAVHMGILLLGMATFIINPVFSARMSTQPGIWLGILLLGWGIYRLITRRQTVQRRDVMVIGIFRGGAMMTMQHASFMIICMLCMRVCVACEKKKWRTVLAQAMVIGCIVGALNSNWILASLQGTTKTLERATSFSQENIAVFATAEHSGIGTICTTLLGYGFRGERYGNTFVPTRSNPRRRIAGCLFVILGWWGRWSTRTSPSASRKRLRWIYGVAGIALVLGVGVASPYTAPLSQRLYDYLPGYRGLREPHKWIGIYSMLLIPGILIGWGKLALRGRRFVAVERIIGASVALLFAWTPGMLNAMRAKYAPTHYPVAYETTRTTLLADETLRQTTRVQLPRHSYFGCARTHNVIANPFKKYFSPLTVISADNIEIGGLYSNSTDPRSQAIETFLNTHDPALLRTYGIGGILFMPTCGDFGAYTWLDTMSGGKTILTTTDVRAITF